MPYVSQVKVMTRSISEPASNPPADSFYRTELECTRDGKNHQPYPSTSCNDFMLLGMTYRRARLVDTSEGAQLRSDTSSLAR